MMTILIPFDCFRRWLSDRAAVAATEFALIFPVLMAMLLGVYDVGNAIWVNQKTIAASQIIADLITRNVSVTDDIIDEAIEAGELALSPYDLTDMGIDIISLSYNVDDEAELVWRETRRMDPVDNVLDRAVGLGVDGDGALAVAVTYVYRPFFGRMVIGEIQMEEMTYARGRRTAVVARE